MKIVALNGSARKGGNTERILGLIEAQLRSAAAEHGIDLDYEYIRLYEQELNICRGCRVCFDRGEEKCPLKDSLLDLYAKLQAADGVIFASPVYVEDVSGIMKNFIDRMAFNCHRPSFAGKTALILTTSGMGSSSHTGRTLKFALGAWGFHLAGTGKFSMGAIMEKDKAAETYGEEIAKLSRALQRSVTEKRALKPSLYSLLVFKVQQKCYLRESLDTASYDLVWWRDKGWLDPKVSFYIPHKANPVKTLIAKILSVPVAKIFT